MHGLKKKKSIKKRGALYGFFLYWKVKEWVGRYLWGTIKFYFQIFSFDKGYYGKFNGRKYVKEGTCDSFYTGALCGELEKFKPGVEEMHKAQKGNEPAISEIGYQRLLGDV